MVENEGVIRLIRQACTGAYFDEIGFMSFMSFSGGAGRFRYKRRKPDTSV